MHVRCDNQYKTGAHGEEGGAILGQPMLFRVHGYLRFEPCAGKLNEGLPCLSTDCKILIGFV